MGSSSLTLYFCLCKDRKVILNKYIFYVNFCGQYELVLDSCDNLS